MTVESRHLWQQAVIMTCRAGAATAVALVLITTADSLSNWKAVLGIALLLVAALDLGWKIHALRHAKEAEDAT